MSGENPEGETAAVEQVERAPTATKITPLLIGKSMISGLIGMILMAPFLLGVPLLLGVFRAEPLAEFANIGSFFGLNPSVLGSVGGFDPNLVIGALIFALGGMVFLPVQFLVVASFLPPESPRFARGGIFTFLWWIGFVVAFWPGGSVLIIGLFLVLSLVSHIIYGFSMGYLLDRWAEIPQHDV